MCLKYSQTEYIRVRVCVRENRNKKAQKKEPNQNNTICRSLSFLLLLFLLLVSIGLQKILFKTMETNYSIIDVLVHVASGVVVDDDFFYFHHKTMRSFLDHIS